MRDLDQRDCCPHERHSTNVREGVQEDRSACDGDSAGQSGDSAGQTSDSVRPEMAILSPDHLKSTLHEMMHNLKVSGEAEKRNHAFWRTQPVKQSETEATKGCNEPIEPGKPACEYRQTPYNLPDGFEWCIVDVLDPASMKELYALLSKNYVEDADSMFRFDYSEKMLLWALTPPCWNCDWLAGIRVQTSQKLVGFIAATPTTLSIRGKVVDAVDVDFLCVSKKLRSKRVAPVLIKEITRRVNLAGVYQAIHTAGVILPTPVASCRYWHRNINMKKLVDIKFAYLPNNMTLPRFNKVYRIPKETATHGFRPMASSDVSSVCKLLNKHAEKFPLSKLFREEQVSHLFLPREEVVYSYVVESNEEVRDFASFYAITSSVLSNPTYTSMKSAYCFYNVATLTPLPQLMTDVLVCAKKLGFDMFNALDLMENKSFMSKLKFVEGTGVLKYYLFNWKCPSFTPEQIAVMLP